MAVPTEGKGSHLHAYGVVWQYQYLPTLARDMNDESPKLAKSDPVHPTPPPPFPSLPPPVRKVIRKRNRGLRKIKTYPHRVLIQFRKRIAHSPSDGERRRNRKSRKRGPSLQAGERSGFAPNAQAVPVLHIAGEPLRGRSSRPGGGQEIIRKDIGCWLFRHEKHFHEGKHPTRKPGDVRNKGFFV